MAINFFNSLAVGTNVLYVDTLNDRVGIGTSSPSFPLEVDGGTGDGVKIKAGNTSNDDSFLIANSSNTTLFVVDGGGNVGIGLTPYTLLNLKGDGLALKNDENGGNNIGVQNLATGTQSSIGFTTGQGLAMTIAHGKNVGIGDEPCE